MNVPPTWRLDGNVAIVTGGSGALGFDIADALAGAGCNVVLTARAHDRATKAAADLEARQAVATLGLPLELGDHGSIARCAEQALAWRGRIDILINCAGGGSGQTEPNLFAREPSDIAATIATNLLGTIYCCREFARPMIAQRRGKIINVASIAGAIGRDRALYRRHGVREPPVDYAAAKAGVMGFTRDLAALVAPDSVQVNAICPGGFDKGTLPAAFVADYAELTPMGRMGTVGRDIKGAALFLASPASDYITGQILVVDGGFSVVK
jgi:NAD(P)-dependent dehydrogenase (short-subunit alcohol dehydrogenase family)